MEQVAHAVVAWALLPLWIAAGLADWACHRATRIEATAGLRENAFHWLLFAELALPVAAVVLLEVNAAVLALLAAGFLLHEATVWIELRYVVPRREVRPIEQMVHSLMEVLPLALLAALAVGQADAPGDWSLRWKAAPWHPAELLALGTAVVLCNILPLVEETRRCRLGKTPGGSRGGDAA